METNSVEQLLRPALQNIGLVGTRGPPKSYVFPCLLASVLGIVILSLLVIALVDLVAFKRCPCCGRDQKE
jgi:hypothetical protein